MIVVPWIHCQEFACNAIRTDFEIYSNDLQITVLKGSFEYSTKPFDDQRTLLILNPVTITYNYNTTKFPKPYLNTYLLYDDHNVYDNYTIVPGTDYEVLGSNIARVRLVVEVDNTTTYWFVVDQVLVDEGSMSMSNGEYIGINNANTFNISYGTYTFPYSVKHRKTKCTSYSKLPEVDSSLPQCLQLIGETIVYNHTNNDEVIGEFNVIYDLQDSTLIATVTNKTLSHSFGTSYFFFYLDDSDYTDSAQKYETHF